jgi:FAD/FMN-containing dehydrogenase/Fe-S oxidoreductase
MISPSSELPFAELSSRLKGELHTSYQWRLLFATDASVYREVPAAVCFPRDKEDLKEIIGFCSLHKIPLIPRAAGTSLAGQVVGHGLVVDTSRHMTKILELNVRDKWVRVQPGVILDDLNRYLKAHGLLFGPETSTSNRCMIGGMLANNSCGSHSIIYGSTRDHTIEISTLLSDGSEVIFGEVDQGEFLKKCIGSSLENKIYNQIYEILSKKENQDEIREQYPDPRLHRRNTGYALDLLLDNQVFSRSEQKFNFCKLLAGSEGSLALFTEIKLNLVDLPAQEKILVCVHLEDIDSSFHANLIALEHGAVAVELIDKVILDCTKTNISQRKNRFFLKGDPGSVLVVEFTGQDHYQLLEKASAMESAMRARGFGYHFPVLKGNDMNKIWELRKAGLGLLSNVPGDAKPVAVIEDAAVHVEKLPDFISELQVLLKQMGLSCVYYAHIGSGEIHPRPVLNLKNPADVERFYNIALQTAHLVKKYKGSLSGEHGDGRLRGEFIPLMLGETIYQLLRQVKRTWDPVNIINPGKITDTPPMKTFLRYTPGQQDRKLQTFFDYPEAQGFQKAVEKCNGSGDCRKPFQAGGVMCPSYHATLEEKHTTRGRANILREFITHSVKQNPFDHKEILEVLELCLSCKGCKSECPSNVDMGKYKAESLQHYYLTHGIPLRTRMVAAFSQLSALASIAPGIYNLVGSSRISSSVVKKIAGFSQKRTLPELHGTTLRKWARKNLPSLNDSIDHKSEVIFFCDEFTNYNDTPTGINALLLLNRLGYKINMPRALQSGRAAISKGMLKKATEYARGNVLLFAAMVSEQTPLVGIEPSAILSFRDEYPSLLRENEQQAAIHLSNYAYTIEEFICREYEAGKIDSSLFSAHKQTVHYHGHCFQKALSSVDFGLRMMSIAPNKTIREISCGCCGMAGSFGYEHYELSMNIGELALFPAIRQAGADEIIAASGTSCRHQIMDGTGIKALHPVDVLFSFLK